LRRILLATELEEGVKWGAPCYMLDGKNIVGMAGFKTYFGLWFHQGALLADKNTVLMNAQEGKTKALRQWRMKSAREIKPAMIKAYVSEAIKLARAGREITPEHGKAGIIPKELKSAFLENVTVGALFKELTLGQRREYADYIAEAKCYDTKLRRIEKILPMIAAGSGLNDKYR